MGSWFNSSSGFVQSALYTEPFWRGRDCHYLFYQQGLKRFRDWLKVTQVLVKRWGRIGTQVCCLKDSCPFGAIIPFNPQLQAPGKTNSLTSVQQAAFCNARHERWRMPMRTTHALFTWLPSFPGTLLTSTPDIAAPRKLPHPLAAVIVAVPTF